MALAVAEAVPRTLWRPGSSSIRASGARPRWSGKNHRGGGWNGECSLTFGGATMTVESFRKNAAFIAVMFAILVAIVGLVTGLAMMFRTHY